jgi:hypothetical protein
MDSGVLFADAGVTPTSYNQTRNLCALCLAGEQKMHTGQPIILEAKPQST